jgi:alkanesulfonate monooxygenase SsuD/methylene tetrahydromethanopterin reductase-like flavin-dependent oxidoreductase (luciferase family)
MQFGLFGGARTKRAQDAMDSHGYRDFVDYVMEAERLGFHSLFLVEHHFTGAGQVSASLTLLAYLAARTRTMRLGTAVVVLPWHNPVLIAEQAATVDLLSGGRLEFGVGKGYRASEFAGFRIPMEEASDRFDEAIGIIRKAWTSEGRFSHRGRRWQFDNIVVEPEPLQRPHPPLWLAAGSADSIRRAAYEGYNLLLDQLTSIELTLERVALFRDACRQVGRSYRPEMVGVTRALQIVRSDVERAAARETRERVIRTIGDLARGGAKPAPDDDAPLLGTPQEIIARIRRLQEGGVENILLVDPAASIASLQTFAAEIMTAFDQEAAVVE